MVADIGGMARQHGNTEPIPLTTHHNRMFLVCPKCGTGVTLADYFSAPGKDDWNPFSIDPRNLGRINSFLSMHAECCWHRELGVGPDHLRLDYEMEYYEETDFNDLAWYWKVLYYVKRAVGS